MPTKSDEELRLIRQFRDAIKGSGQSLNQLARAADIGADQLSRFLRGERSLTLPAVAKVCDVLGLELAQVAPPAEKKPARKPKGK